MDAIEFSYQLTQADVATAHRRFVVRRQPAVLLPAAMFAFFALSGGPGSFALIVSALAVGFAAWILVWLPVQRFRALKPGQLSQRGRMTESRLELSNELARHSIEWSLFKGFAARKDALDIFTNANAILIIPRRAFASGAEFDAAVQLASQKIRPPRQLWRTAVLVVVLVLLFFTFFSILNRQHPPDDQRRPAAGSR